MESEGNHLAKCICNSCGVKLEFPIEIAGTTIACPKCSEQTFLILASDIDDKSALDNPTISAEAILSSFNGDLRRHGASFFYQAGLMLVTIAIVILPLLYVALVGLSGYGVYWWARKGTMLFGGNGYGNKKRVSPRSKYWSLTSPIFEFERAVIFAQYPLSSSITAIAQISGKIPNAPADPFATAPPVDRL